MTHANIVKDSIDLGIVVSDPEKSLAFYRDILGFVENGTMAMPGGGKMYRLLCGTTVIKLVHAANDPQAAAGGGINGARGYRYFTISVSNLEEITAHIASSGYKVAVPSTEIRPGISISIVEDPDGNWVEFLQMA